MSSIATAIRWILVILAVLATNMIVFTLSPGNWLTAIVLSTITMIVLLPPADHSANRKPVKTAKLASMTGSRDEKASLVIDNEIPFTNEQDMIDEEKEFHSMLGSVFRNMAKNAGLDLYSSEISDTASPVQYNGNIPASEKDRVSIELEMDTDGKPHYTFREDKPVVDEQAGMASNSRIKAMKPAKKRGLLSSKRNGGVKE